MTDHKDVAELIAAAASSVAKSSQQVEVKAPAKSEGTDYNAQLQAIIHDLDKHVQVSGSLHTYTSKHHWIYKRNREKAGVISYLYDLARKGDITSIFRHLNKRFAKLIFMDADGITSRLSLLDVKSY